MIHHVMLYTYVSEKHKPGLPLYQKLSPDLSTRSPISRAA